MRDGYSVGGRLTFTRPAKIDEVLSLDGAYLVPPFGDAHSHSFGMGQPEAEKRYAQAYLRDGVFYVQIQGNLPMSEAEKATLKFNTPEGPDVSLSNGTLTGGKADDACMAVIGFLSSPRDPAGIGVELFPGWTLEQMEDVRCIQMATPADVEAKWPLIQAQKDDFYKVYIVDSAREVEQSRYPGRPPAYGIPADVLAEVVKRAHAEGKRVSAHVTTQADLKLAIAAGVDEIAHIPLDGVAEAEARLLAEKKIPIVTTLSGGRSPRPGEPQPSPQKRGDEAKMLRTMMDLGVPVAIGVDRPFDTTAYEAAYVKDLAGFTNAEMLRIWGTHTPLAIFPDRKIGRLEEGYEASFLALDGDPLDDWSNTKSIRLRFKQGKVLNRG